MPDVTLHLGDCLDFMRTLPAGSVDAVIADLPYGTTACAWDVVIPFEPLWTEYKRLIKPRGAVVLFGSQPFTSLLVTSNLEWFKYCVVWEKSHAANFMSAKSMPLMKHEDIAVFGRNGITFNPQIVRGPRVMKRSGKVQRDRTKESIYGTRPAILENVASDMYYPSSVQSFSAGAMSQRLHPTQKPVALLEYLVRTYTNPGDVVLDNTMGSGTTGVACIQTGRNFIGCEIDAGYFEIAQRRIALAQQQPLLPGLLDPPPQPEQASFL